VFVPVRVSGPVPVFASEPEPLITPATETLLPFVSTVPAPVSETVRVDGDVIVPPACSVPPLKISVFVALPSPMAALAVAFSVPAETVVLPLYVFVPVRVSVPVPLFVSEPEPLITPAIETPFPFVSIVPVEERVTDRVDGDVIVPPACSVPPENTKLFVALPSPIAALEFAFTVPAEIVVAPLYVFVPVSVSVPLPVFVSPFEPLMTPAIETPLPFVSISPVEDNVTARVDGDVIVPPACNVPPEKTSVLFASPSAELEFAFSVPAEIVVLPVYVFDPVSVSVAAPAFVRPNVEPEITPPTVSVFADTVT
jgi:hypothetical protein